MANTTLLYYAHDPMCSYCYAFKAPWKKLKAKLPKSIEIVSILGGLAPDNDEPMAQDMQDKLIHTWQRIESRYKIKFNFDFWTKNTPRRSTYPACRAILIAKKYSLENQMIEAIQQAYYLKAHNPSDIKVLAGCAEAIGIKQDEFILQIQSSAINNALKTELAQARKLGLNSFPSLLLAHNNNQTKIPVDYTNYQSMLETIELLINL